MAPTKGAALEELVRAYFARQGYFAVRSVPYRFEEEEVTDLDVWLYSRPTASARIKAIVDVKNKRSPKAFERVLWVKGIQDALQCDRAFVATTDASASLVRFASGQKITVLSKSFLERLEKKLEVEDRLTLEAFSARVTANPSYKQDGDWLRVLGDAKSAVASLPGFQAFNKTMFAFKFFAERAEVRMQNRDIAVRCALLTAGLACIALDAALARFVFEDADRRLQGLIEGVHYGDAGDGRARKNLENAVSVLSEGMENGRAIAAKARANLDTRLGALRADVIGEHFMREHNAQHLFGAGKELDEAAHSIEPRILPLEVRAILGVFADFVGVKRTTLPIGNVVPVATTTAAPPGEQVTTPAPEPPKETAGDKAAGAPEENPASTPSTEPGPPDTQGTLI